MKKFSFSGKKKNKTNMEQNNTIPENNAEETTMEETLNINSDPDIPGNTHLSNETLKMRWKRYRWN